MRKLTVRTGGVALLASLLAGAAHADRPMAQLSPASNEDRGAQCSALKGSKVGAATVDSATYYAPGAKLPPINIPTADGLCQVRLSGSPVPASKIKIEMWLPTRWNGKMLGLGGSGTSGGMVLAPLAFPRPVADGYATLATDAGHDNTDLPTWALQNERVVDYGYRANNLGAQVGKALIARFYGKPARRAYFQGCSNGGRDALMLAQRFPRTYDGIVAGAPAINFVSLMTSFGVFRRAVDALPANSLTPKLPMLHAAVLQRCDARDGVKDGLVTNGRACRFDPGVLACKPGQDTKSCLAPAELRTVRTLYGDVRTRDGHLVNYGLPVGSEYLWDKWWTPPNSTGGDFPPKMFGYFVYKDPKWTMASFDLDNDWKTAMQRLSGTLDASDTDLRPFVRGGGKLLMYQGWDDQAVAPQRTIDYFESVRRKLGGAASSAQLFMVPGMGHCFDGKGLTNADFVGQIDRWVESGHAPASFTAERPANPLLAIMGAPGKPAMSRPLCAWPKAAYPTGKGSINEAAGYVCR